MPAILIEPHYLPSLEYFCALAPFDTIMLEHHEHYVKQSLRNRCYIKTARGVEMLVVPLTGKHGKVPFGEVRVESGTKWRNNHWRTLVSAYANAPFFEHYAGDLNHLLFRNHHFLRDLSTDLLSFCLTSLHSAKHLSATVAYDADRHDVSDLRSTISAKTDWSERAYYSPQSYYQVFGNAFAANLSVIDLLFCEGPGAPGVLKGSEKKI